MSSITITGQRDTSDGWKFAVSVDKHVFSITLDHAYWQELTGEKQTPEELIRHACSFLLSRESVEEILPSFSLHDIKKYFPEFEEEIKKLM